MARKTKDPKVGTGKKPKGSGRRLYTDENPKDTVSIKFATPEDARKTVSKVKRIRKPFARKIQILTVLEQRAKVAGKKQQAMIAKKGKEAIRKAHGTKKVKEVLELGQNKNGELSLVRSLQKLENVIYQKKLLKTLVLQNTLQLREKNEKILKKVNSILNNLRRLLRKYESTGK